MVTRLLLRFWLVMLLALMVPAGASAAGLESPDVYRLATVVSQEVEYLRWYMGRPRLKQEKPRVRHVSPHEVYFQAVTLFEKANRLNFELTLDSGSLPNPPIGDIHPEHVYGVLKAVANVLGNINYTLDIVHEVEMPPRNASMTPTDVFQVVVQANRQINLMIDQQFSPSDAYRQVSVALAYAESILATQDNLAPPPAPVPLTPGKRPVDVYRRLLAVYDIIHQLSDKRGLPLLDLVLWTTDEQQVRPSDVFDVASLLVSELAYIHTNMPDARPPRKVIWVRGKFPSDVYQRVDVLEFLLMEILARMK